MSEIPGPFYDQPPEPIEQDEYLVNVGRELRQIIKRLKKEGVQRKADRYYEAFERLKEMGYDLQQYNDEEGIPASFLFEPLSGKLEFMETGLFIGYDASLDKKDVIPAVILNSEGVIIADLFSDDPPDEPNIDVLRSQVDKDE